MKQTAMQELRSILIDESERYRKSDMRGEFVVATKILIKIENELLEREKEQIMDARMQDMDSGLDPSTYIDIAEEYYNQTYSKESK